MRGQAFTIDLFNAYTVFLVLMLVVLIFSLWVVDAMMDKEVYDETQKKVIYGLDYISYNQTMAYLPYDLKKEGTDAFFSMSQNEIKDLFHLGNFSYSLKLNYMNGTNIISNGGELSNASEIAISLERNVRYNGTDARLVFAVWEF